MAFVIAEDVAKIKQELLANPHHHMLTPNLKNLTQAKGFYDELLTAINDPDAAGISNKLGATQVEIRKQIGASAICTAIYVTAVSSTVKASTRVQSMRHAKSLLNSLKIQLPNCLMATLTRTIQRVDQEGGKQNKHHEA